MLNPTVVKAGGKRKQERFEARELPLTLSRPFPWLLKEALSVTAGRSPPSPGQAQSAGRSGQPGGEAQPSLEELVGAEPVGNVGWPPGILQLALLSSEPQRARQVPGQLSIPPLLSLLLRVPAVQAGW